MLTKSTIVHGVTIRLFSIDGWSWGSDAEQIAALTEKRAKTINASIRSLQRKLVGMRDLDDNPVPVDGEIQPGCALHLP
jgi:hypothetical protein